MTKLPVLANGSSRPPDMAAKTFAFVNEEANAAMNGEKESQPVAKAAKTFTLMKA